MTAGNLGEILEVDTTIKYSYDFGSTTNLTIKVLHKGQVKKGEDGKPKVELVMRNRRPTMTCAKRGCFEVAKVIGQENYKAICEKHAKKIYGNVEACNDECLGVSNSPRSGVCGYQSDNNWNDSDDDFTPLDWQGDGEPQEDDTSYDDSDHFK